MEEQFYDLLDQTKYKIIVQRPESVEELSDLFITDEELKDMVGAHCTVYGNKPRTFFLDNVIKKEVAKWADKLEASGKKTLEIEDEELVDAIKAGNGYMSDFDDTGKYGRHGNRICYARRYKRVKKKATLGDVRYFWLHLFPHAFRKKYGCYPPHVNTYDRHLPMFKAAKKLLGWKNVNAVINDPETRKFTKQIWDNPEEFIR